MNNPGIWDILRLVLEISVWQTRQVLFLTDSSCYLIFLNLRTYILVASTRRAFTSGRLPTLVTGPPRGHYVRTDSQTPRETLLHTQWFTPTDCKTSSQPPRGYYSFPRTRKQQNWLQILVHSMAAVRRSLHKTLTVPVHIGSVTTSHLTVIITLHALKTYLWGWMFGPFGLRPFVFVIQGGPKIGNTPNDPKLNLNT